MVAYSTEKIQSNISMFLSYIDFLSTSSYVFLYIYACVCMYDVSVINKLVVLDKILNG